LYIFSSFDLPFCLCGHFLVIALLSVRNA
jgi:hypothetical protein